MQIAEEKQAVAQYGSSDSGATLGDILGAALKEAQPPKETKELKEAKETKKSKK
jgi:small subunit ribosomal protein S1